MLRQGTTALLLLYSLLCYRAVSGCTSGFMQLDLLKERAKKLTGGNEVSGNFIYHGLRVWPGQNFTCNGNITSVMVGVDVRAAGDGRNDYPQVDVWRREESVTLQRVDNTLVDIAPAFGDFSPDGVLRYNLTTPIAFETGDYLSVYQPPNSQSIVRMYFEDDTSAPYAEFNNASNGGFGNNIVHTGTNQDLFNQRVLIRVETDPPGCTGPGFLTPEQLRQDTQEVNINRVVTRDRQQRVFPEIRFTCSGSINKWIVGARAAGGSSSPSELQIWRKGGSIYNKVGSTQLTAQSPTSDPNVYEYTLSAPLEFQEGDILGVYQNDGSAVVPYYQENTGPINRRGSGQVNGASTSLVDPPLAAEYDYPLVTVEIAGPVLSSTPTPAGLSTSQVQDEVDPSTTTQDTPRETDSDDKDRQSETSSVSSTPAPSQATPPSPPPVPAPQDSIILYISVALIAGAILIVAVTILAVVIGICIWKRRNSKKSQHAEEPVKRNSYLVTSFNKDDQQHAPHVVIGSNRTQDTGPAMNMQQNQCYDTAANMKTDGSNEPMYEDLDAVVPNRKLDNTDSELYYI